VASALLLGPFAAAAQELLVGCGVDGCCPAGAVVLGERRCLPLE
jgi:hypothetical protein